jgi:TetR/AcrR family transcriptional repressor of nem operon
MPRTKQFDESEALKKAMLLFWKKGFHNTSIHDLVQALGINRGSLYSSFGGKRKLFNQALELYLSSGSKGMDFLIVEQQEVKAALRKVFENIINDDCNDEDRKGCFAVNTATEMLPADSQILEVLALNKLNMEAHFLKFLEKGVLAGQISNDKDIKTISTLLYTLMSGLRVNGKITSNPAQCLASVDAVLSLLD